MCGYVFNVHVIDIRSYVGYVQWWRWKRNETREKKPLHGLSKINDWRYNVMCNRIQPITESSKTELHFFIENWASTLLRHRLHSCVRNSIHRHKINWKWFWFVTDSRRYVHALIYANGQLHANPAVDVAVTASTMCKLWRCVITSLWHIYVAAALCIA